MIIFWVLLWKYTGSCFSILSTCGWWDWWGLCSSYQCDWLFSPDSHMRLREQWDDVFGAGAAGTLSSCLMSSAWLSLTVSAEPALRLRGWKLKSRSWRCLLQMHSLLGREKKEKYAGIGDDLIRSPGFPPHAASMFSCVGCFWVLLSSALVAVCSFSFISPAWIVKDQLRNHHQHQHHSHHNNHHHHSNKDSVSFGLLWHCSESMDHMYRCYTFSGLGKFSEIPSSSWQVQ